MSRASGSSIRITTDRHQVARHDADDPGTQIVPRRRGGPQAACRGGVATPQQETRQREEHRYREVEPAEQPARHAAAVTGLERDVGEHHTHGGAGAHPFDGGQEASRPADVG